jgi:hypothetical protein
VLSSAGRRRRQIARRTGLALLALGSAGIGAVACIFDDGGDYQGGGRRETIVTATPTAAPTDEVDLDGSLLPDTGGGLGPLPLPLDSGGN